MFRFGGLGLRVGRQGVKSRWEAKSSSSHLIFRILGLKTRTAQRIALGV